MARLSGPKAIREAYREGLGDGLVYATAVMAGREDARREWLDIITEKKRALAAPTDREG